MHKIVGFLLRSKRAAPKFIQGKLEGKSSAQAARDAGYSESVSRHADLGRTLPLEITEALSKRPKSVTIWNCCAADPHIPE